MQALYLQSIERKSTQKIAKSMFFRKTVMFIYDYCRVWSRKIVIRIVIKLLRRFLILLNKVLSSAFWRVVDAGDTAQTGVRGLRREWRQSSTGVHFWLELEHRDP